MDSRLATAFLCFGLVGLVVAEVTFRPDGSVYSEDAQGNVVITDDEGNAIIQDKKGNKVTMRSDGSIFKQYQRGGTMTLGSGGSIIQKDSRGNTVTLGSDGSIIKQDSSGFTETLDSNGYVFAPGIHGKAAKQQLRAKLMETERQVKAKAKAVEGKAKAEERAAREQVRKARKAETAKQTNINGGYKVLDMFPNIKEGFVLESDSTSMTFNTALITQSYRKGDELVGVLTIEFYSQVVERVTVSNSLAGCSIHDTTVRFYGQLVAWQPRHKPPTLKVMYNYRDEKCILMQYTVPKRGVFSNQNTVQKVKLGEFTPSNHRECRDLISYNSKYKGVVPPSYRTPAATSSGGAVTTQTPTATTTSTGSAVTATVVKPQVGPDRKLSEEEKLTKFNGGNKVLDMFPNIKEGFVLKSHPMSLLGNSDFYLEGYRKGDERVGVLTIEFYSQEVDKVTISNTLPPSVTYGDTAKLKGVLIAVQTSYDPAVFQVMYNYRDEKCIQKQYTLQDVGNTIQVQKVSLGEFTPSNSQECGELISYNSEYKGVLPPSYRTPAVTSSGGAVPTQTPTATTTSTGSAVTATAVKPQVLEFTQDKKPGFEPRSSTSNTRKVGDILISFQTQKYTNGAECLNTVTIKINDVTAEELTTTCQDDDEVRNRGVFWYNDVMIMQVSGHEVFTAYNYRGQFCVTRKFKVEKNPAVSGTFTLKGTRKLVKDPAQTPWCRQLMDAPSTTTAVPSVYAVPLRALESTGKNQVFPEYSR